MLLSIGCSWKWGDSDTEVKQSLCNRFIRVANCRHSLKIEQEIFPINRMPMVGIYGEEVGGLSKSFRQISNITAMAASVYNCVEQHPDRDVEELLSILRMNRRPFYEYLLGLSDQSSVCKDGVFRVMDGDQRLTVEAVEHYLADCRGDNRPKRSERILYLYNLLHRNIPYGGVSFEEILQQYLTLLEHSTRDLPKIDSIRRMIYRDIDELEKIGIIIDRPATGSSKYSLRDKYLPKLPFEQASSLYVSMLLFEDTILDQMSNSAKEEFEKAFFRNSPEESVKINDRIHVVGDTLVNPEEVGDKFTKLVTAVINSYQIEITYSKLEGEISLRTIKPLGLVFKRGVWYVVAEDPNKKEYRTFRVDQILKASLTNIMFEYPEGFSLAEHIGGSWGVFTNDEVQEVRLKFSSAVATRVKSLRYHRSQEVIEELTDGSVIIGLEVCGLIELKGWLLQWGPQVEVLEPEILRQEMLNTAQELVNLYRV
jgi:predicted DNA-binding transcriptional regulator YafY